MTTTNGCTTFVRGLAIAGLAIALPSAMRAQECTTCATPDSTPSRTLVLPALGARVGVPEKASLAIGLVAGLEWRTNGRRHTRDFALFVEPGLGASRASIAYMDARNFGSGFGFAATVMRTMDDTWASGKGAFAFPPSSTLVGGEILIWPVFLVGPRIGIFHRVNDASGGRRWFVSADFGFGL